MSRYYVGEWLLEPEQSRVVRGSESRKLDPKSVQVLTFLAEHPDEVLSKEKIIDFVWSGAFVSDEILTTAIWGLRKALGDDAKEPRYIQTIPRQRRFSEVLGRWAESEVVSNPLGSVWVTYGRRRTRTSSRTSNGGDVPIARFSAGRFKAS